MWGASPTFRPEDWLIAQRGMFIDGDAATVSTGWDGDVAHADFLKYDVTNIAQFLPGHKRAAVIGVGGGRDILSARVFGVPDITGAELNPILVNAPTCFEATPSRFEATDSCGASKLCLRPLPLPEVLMARARRGSFKYRCRAVWAREVAQFLEQGAEFLS
jgi:hypothetical protein